MSAPKEQFSNDADDTLANGIDSDDLSLTVTDGSEYPAAGNFRLRIGEELLLCTARIGDTMTVVRAVEGSTAASHSSGARVVHVITSEGFARWAQDEGAMPDRPPLASIFGASGRLVASDFSSVGGVVTKTDQNGTILMRLPAGAADEDISAEVIAAPATPYSVIGALQFVAALDSDGTGGSHFGLCFRESGSGKLICLALVLNPSESPPRLGLFRFDSPTAAASPNYLDRRNAYQVGPYSWFRLADDGTDLTFYIGDGWNWIEVYSVGRTNYMSGGPNQVGFYGANPSNGLESLVRLCHFSLE